MEGVGDQRARGALAAVRGPGADAVQSRGPTVREEDRRRHILPIAHRHERDEPLARVRVVREDFHGTGEFVLLPLGRPERHDPGQLPRSDPNDLER